MTVTELINALSVEPDPEKRKDRDVTRVARVRLTWNEQGKFWEFGEPESCSTYYEEKK